MKGNKIRKVMCALCSAAVLPALCLSACADMIENIIDENTHESVTRNYTFFGQRAVLSFFDLTDSQQVLSAADACSKSLYSGVHSVEGAVYSAKLVVDSSTGQVADTDVTRYNAEAYGSNVAVSYETFSLYLAAKEVYEETDGWYNPAMYLSRDLYGFTPQPDYLPSSGYDRQNNRTELPGNEYVRRFAELAGYFSQIELTYGDHTADLDYNLSKPVDAYAVAGGYGYSIGLDFSGMYEGVAVDKAQNAIAADNSGELKKALFEFGSSALVRQPYLHTGETYFYSVPHPRPSAEDEGYMSFAAQDVKIVSAGDYKDYYEIGGRRYCDIFDPFTGEPIDTGVISATIAGNLSSSAAVNQARAAAMCAMGAERAIEYINSQNIAGAGLKVALVLEHSDGKLYLITNMAEGEYTFEDKDITVASLAGADGTVSLKGEMAFLLT